VCRIVAVAQHMGRGAWEETSCKVGSPPRKKRANTRAGR
jgi:hypothetical protein